MKRYFVLSFLLLVFVALIFSVLIFTGGALFAQGAAVAPVGGTVASGERLVEPVVQVGHGDCVQYVAFTPDARHIVSDDYSATILWDAQTGKKLREYPGEAVLSPDGKKIFTYGRQTNVVVDLLTGETLANCKVDDEAIRCAAFDTASQFLATGHGVLNEGEPCSVRIWDIATGKIVRTMTGHKKLVRSMAFASQSDILAAGDGNGTVVLWNWKTGEKIFEHDNEHQNGVVERMVFRPDSSELVSYNPGNIVFLDVPTKRITKRLSVHKYSPIYSPDGEQIIAPDYGNNLCFYNAKTKEIISELRTGHTKTINAMTFSPDGKFFLTGSSDQTVILWDVKTWKPLRQFGQPKSGSSRYYTALSPNGQYVAAGTAQGALLLFDAKTGFQVWKTQAHTSDIKSVAFSPDEAMVVTGSVDKTTKLWDSANGALIKEFDEQGMWCPQKTGQGYTR